MYAMGGLAGMLEFIKIMLAVSFPFIQYRDIKREKKVSFYLKICFFLSVMASLNFFLTGGEIERSPASNITALIYNYVPLFYIIPLKFSQFITTMSLSILVEAFIVFLPILAPIMFLEKDYTNRKEIAVTNIEKIKEIIVTIPNRAIDSLYKKVVGEIEHNDIRVEEIETERPNLKLLRFNESLVRTGIENNKKIKNTENNNISENEEVENPVHIDNRDGNKGIEADTNILESGNPVHIDITDKVKNAIFDYAENNICPSIRQLMELTELTKNEVVEAKKELETEGLIYTEGFKTYIVDDTNENWIYENKTYLEDKDEHWN